MVCLGPIVRISPYEVHVQDPDFYDQLYSRSGRRDKYAWLKERLGDPHSLFSTSNHDLHRVRRAALNPCLAGDRFKKAFSPLSWRRSTNCAQNWRRMVLTTISFFWIGHTVHFQEMLSPNSRLRNATTTLTRQHSRRHYLKASKQP